MLKSRGRGRNRAPKRRQEGLAMPIRLRKLIGAAALIVLVLSWTLIAMAVAQFPAVQGSGIFETVYYVLAGLGWVLPAMPLVRWMSKESPRG
jgi:hypothetical protein